MASAFHKGGPLATRNRPKRSMTPEGLETFKKTGGKVIGTTGGPVPHHGQREKSTGFNLARRVADRPVGPDPVEPDKLKNGERETEKSHA
ncbi:MAG: hypothetical protein AAF514_06055 [Verrucomicrobiota bacterium]